MKALVMVLMIAKIERGCPRKPIDTLNKDEAKKTLEFLRLNAKVLNQYLRLKDNKRLRTRLDYIYSEMRELKRRIGFLKFYQIGD